ncbi:MAG: glycosyltransferase family 2 protein, partial [Frankiales bacterium]|nr:glycosyltransferase family 2 protein [Frankiales bacterium]
MPLDVSVVVPVYNTGVHIEPCIESLLAQSLPRSRHELIFVDDGSTDGTGERLDRLAAEQNHVRVIHHDQPSGWAGKPRNSGIDAARGEYVQFLDDDDTLAPKALEQQIEFARHNRSDIVIGKMVGVRRGAPSTIYSRDQERATFETAPFWTSFSVHKMFRKAFLDEHAIRFPEEAGRRLEDQYFMLRAYFAADVVSILGSRVCYYHHRRPDQGNLTAVIIDPPSYYGYLRESLDLIDQQALPADVRERILHRLYEHEMFRRLTEPRVLKLPEFHVEDLVREVGKLLDERFPREFDEQFAPIVRARAAAVRRGDSAAILGLGATTVGVSLDAQLQSFGGDSRPYVARLTAELRHEDDAPVTVRRAAEGWAIDPRLVPEQWAVPLRDDEPLDVGVSFALRNRKTWVEWYPESSVDVRLVPVDDEAGSQRIVLDITVPIDPRAVGGGRPLTRGSWDLWLKARVLGLRRTVRVRVAPVDLSAVGTNTISGGRLLV